ncbi:DUF5131 family protein [Methylobacterium haplocladii]|uniref:DUF5131 family protein n=1 Tax=Methylobacterium haplocladii TaxID=1176176 RepID=A0A512ISC9_9HYPH|nr:DUF5131 family protein [Methylobacterium haplocladii]GEP00593.1 hypothetical protein MHA02_29800 [Methylobacterium haplocladii]GJD85508.1 hypothetical protein HPGCJGGD_3397 [Methylobacterium haplocladii]GLS57741.1 hypothetical protein GCM10007887_03970 [Methylobacterium haplocladii]
MAETTGISWCDRTWSPWIGCTKISPACDGCYAAHLMDTRMGRVEWGPHGVRQRTSETYWRNLGKWDREAKAAGRIITVFPSLCDPWDNAADPGIRREWFAVMRETPSLMHLLLSKRPQNAVAMARAAGGLPKNAALGATCENQEVANRNVRHLLDAARELYPAFTFVSAEPLLGPIDFTRIDYGTIRGHTVIRDALKASDIERIDWVITGGETGQGQHKARPSHPDWFRLIQEQCTAAGVPYHHKQNGEWSTTHPNWPRAHPTVMANDGTLYRPEDLAYPDGPRYGEAIRANHDKAHLTNIYRVGKKLSGRLLDGVEYNGMPELRP